MPPINSRRVFGSMDEIADALKSSGKAFKKSPSQMVNDRFVGDTGTGSLFGDMAMWPIKKTKLGKKLNKAVEGGQKKLTDLDMKMGKKVVDSLSKNPNAKFRNKVADKFVDKHLFETQKKNPKAPKEFIEVESAGLTNPLGKMKDKALPFIGAVAVSNAMMSSGKKEGENNMAKLSSEEYKHYLISKIAETIDEDEVKRKLIENKEKEKLVANERRNRQAELCKKASETLFEAAKNIRALESRNLDLAQHAEKLALQNQRLLLEKEAEERAEKAEKLANKMLNKGLIKRADLDTRIKEYCGMDKEAFDMFSNAVDNAEKIAASEGEGVDSLAYIGEDPNLKAKKTMADAINTIHTNY
ncbi:MAG: hypothetical protein RR420_00825 [Anaerovoracaceae bacterium]